MPVWNPPPIGLTNVNVSAGATSNNLSHLVFADSNGVSFGLNGSTVTASAAVGGGGITNVKWSAGTVSALRSDITFGDSHGLSFGLETNGVITGSYTVPTVTNSSWSISDAATSGTVGRLAFTNLHGMTLSVSSGAGGLHTIIGSHNGLTSQSNQAISGSNGSFAFQTVTVGNLNGLSFYTSNGSLVGSYTVPTQSNQTIGVYLSSNTTSSVSSGTLDARSMTFRGVGVASVGYSGGEVVISVPAGGGGLTNINLSAGTTSNNLSDVVFSNSHGVSFGLNGSTVTASVAAGGGQTVRWFSNPLGQAAVAGGIGNAMMSLQPFILPANLTATQLNVVGHMSGASGSTGGLSVSFGIYTFSGSTLSLASSTSSFFSWSTSSPVNSTVSSQYGGQSGTRYRTYPTGTWNMTPGNYVFAAWCRTTNAGTWTLYGQSSVSIRHALAAAESTIPLNGMSTSSFTTAMPASINLTNTQYVRTGQSVNRQPGFLLMGSY